MSLDHLYADREGYALVDLSQIALATAMKTNEKGEKFQVAEVRHMILSTLKHNVLKFKSEGFNNIVICVDNAKDGYWKKQFAKYYKGNRAISREKKKDEFDWIGYFEGLNTTIGEIKQFMPYIVLDVQFAEADDCIGVLSKLLVAKGFKVRIISSDGDFTQLHEEWVDQYSPIQKQFVKVKTSSPEEDCLTKILKGDKKDCVASIKVCGDFYLKDIDKNTPQTTAKFVTDALGKTEDELHQMFIEDVKTKLLAVKSGKKWIETELIGFGVENVEQLIETHDKDQLIEIVLKERLKEQLVLFYGMDSEKVSSAVETKSMDAICELIGTIRLKRFKENRVLIDFNYIRDDIKQSIIDEFNSYKPAPRGKMYSYFVKSGLVKLLKDINSF